MISAPFRPKLQGRHAVTYPFGITEYQIPGFQHTNYGFVVQNSNHSSLHPADRAVGQRFEFCGRTGGQFQGPGCHIEPFNGMSRDARAACSEV